MTMLPATVKADLARHLERVRDQHRRDLETGAGWVELPTALSRKYPHAGREWVWQWVFPATRIYVERLTGERRRHHLHESVSAACREARGLAFRDRQAPARTRCGTPSPRTCSRMAATSGPSRSFWGIGT